VSTPETTIGAGDRAAPKFAIIRETNLGGVRTDSVVRLGRKIGDGRFMVYYVGTPDSRCAYQKWINPSDIFETVDQARAALALEAAA
jgi:hypothetical protein